MKNTICISLMIYLCLTHGIKAQELNKKYTVSNSDTLKCRLLDIPEKLKLNKPFDIAVSNDGNVVYVLQDLYPLKVHNLYKRNFIYKITQDKKIDILKINNSPPVSCREGYDIEKDDKDNIYINDLENNCIYKISEKNNKIEKIIEVKEKPSYAEPEQLTLREGQTISPNILGGPLNLYVNNQDVYFVMSVNYIVSSELHIKKFNNGKTDELVLTKNPEAPIFVVYNNKIFADFSGYPYSREKPKTNGILEINPPFIYPNYTDSKEPNRTKIIDLLGSSKYELFQIRDMRMNSKGELFISDIDKNIIWKAILDQNKIFLFAGNGKAGFKDGIGENAQFNLPSTMDFDAQDNLYIADIGNNAIRKIT